MRKSSAVVAAISLLAAGTVASSAYRPGIAVAQSAAPAPTAGRLEAVTVRGTVQAIDKDKRTVTLVGPQGGTLTLTVQDPEKLDAVNVGDPVVATYFEALAIRLRNAGGAKPGVSTTDTTASSKPGEAPAGAITSEVTLTATIAGVDAKQGTVTIKPVQGHPETMKVRDPAMLAGVRAGDLVELTYTRGLAVALDKPPGN